MYLSHSKTRIYDYVSGEVVVVGAGDNNNSHVELWTLSTHKMPVHRQYAVSTGHNVYDEIKCCVQNLDMAAANYLPWYYNLSVLLLARLDSALGPIYTKRCDDATDIGIIESNGNK